MSTNIDLSWEWLEAEEEDREFPLGPEARTRAEFGIQFDGNWITRHRPAGLEKRQPRNTVVGSLSGLADWFVENWASLHQEIETPFEMPSEGMASEGRIFPRLRHTETNKAIANWQHRHVVGHATSDLALPSMVVVPDREHVTVELAELPAAFQCPVEFVPPEGRQFPTSFGFQKPEFFSAIEELIEAVIERGEEFEETARWAGWLGERWGCKNSGR